jgi:glycosyltransferase involved in cell wall biosynthesis
MPHNVLHILGTAQPQGMGIARIVSALARGLDPERYRIHACFLGEDGPLANVIKAAGAQVSNLRWQGGLRDPGGAWRFWRRWQGEKIAIVHVHFGGRFVLWLARASTHGKIVLHLHGSINESQGVEFAIHSGRGADKVIAVSHAIAERVAGFEARVVYSGVEFPKEKSGSVLPGSVTGRVLGTAGRLAKIKGIADLFHALAALRVEMPDISLEIAGSGPERASLETEVRRLGLGNHVRFLGWRSDLPAVFGGWDVFVQPSLDEGLPIATIEAMAAGIPVVACAVGGIPELVEDEVTGFLVPSRGVLEMTDRLRSLLSDPERRRRMGSAARRRVENRFSVKQMISEITEVYDEILDLGPSAGMNAR